MKIRKSLGVLLACTLVFTACATQPPQSDPNGKNGGSMLVRGVTNLILSPFQIAAGLLQGVAALPYYASTGLQEINQGMVKAQARVTLDDTYEAAYGKRINQVSADGDTGEVFRRMKHATEFFQRVLKQYGVRNPENYILTSIDTANKEGYTLFAVVYRPAKSIKVIDKYDGKTVRHFTSEDRLFYEPFAADASGKPVDVIIDWAGVPTDAIRTQKQQAVLLTLAANSVASEKRRADYWEAEKRWIVGEYLVAMNSQTQRVQHAMGI